MADAQPQRSLTFDAAAGELCAALRWIYEIRKRLGAAESECLSLQLAVEEVCTNLIEFGYDCCGGAIAIGIAGSGVIRLGMIDR